MAASLANVPGRFLVDTLPICAYNEEECSDGLIRVNPVKYVPEWMPGAGFKTQARAWRHLATQVHLVPFNVCKKALVRQSSTTLFTVN
jgi:hypothetical protein